VKLRCITKESNVETIPVCSRNRYLPATLIAVGVIACIGGALTIPFFFESPTMYYKFGMDKMLLRFAKMVGLAAAVLLLLQLPLAGRLKWLDRIFSIPGLYRIHRFNAYLIGVLIMSHPMLVLAPEGRWRVPFELRYWPEWVGVSLLIMIIVQIGLTRWRAKVFRAYHKWRRVHYALGIIILFLLIVHILYVSETFEQPGLPRNLVFAAVSGSIVLWLWIRKSRLRCKKKQFKVSRIKTVGLNAYRIDLEPAIQPHFSYMPGQFAFVSFESAQISREYHPFTISSTPSRPGGLQFTIRCNGDWTDHIDTIKKGDRAFIQGPFGRFSHLLHPAHREVIMIAGGIGLTPILSMLRYMRDRDDSRRITLIWSNRTRAQLFSADEMTVMQEKLTNFNRILSFTRETGNGNQFGRLDRTALERLLQPCSRKSIIFLCGPPAMVKEIRKDLNKIGFSKKSIHDEVFAL
jgi:predicted ferric reductase